MGTSIHMLETQHEIFASDISQWTKRFATMFAYIIYYRWKHGRKALQPLMKLSGMSTDYI